MNTEPTSASAFASRASAVAQQLRDYAEHPTEWGWQPIYADSLRAWAALLDEAAAARAEGRAEGLREAAGVLHDKSLDRHRTAHRYPPERDGGDGTRQECLDEAVTLMDAAIAIVALINKEPSA